MKKMLLFVLYISCAINGYSQYFDWVYDEKTLSAMQKEWKRKGKRINSWMNDEATIAKEQEEIARKVTFIEFVRDSLYKSLQDVEGIATVDKKTINRMCYDIEFYQLKIDSIAKKRTQFKKTAESCQKKFVERSHELQNAIAYMATKGGDEKNLMNKKQRMKLLQYVVKELASIRLSSVIIYECMLTSEKKPSEHLIFN